MNIGEVQPTIEVIARKYDGSICRTWRMNLIRASSSLIELSGRFEKEIRHPELGVISKGTISMEFFWPSRWYNVFRFIEPDGQFRNLYCNISTPPEFDGATLEYVDLDLDLLVERDGDFRVLDDLEFLENARIFGYPDELVRSARNAVDELTAMIENRMFPFDI